MQLRFLPDEFTMLADILLNQPTASHLLNQVLERRLHLDCDDLDQLHDILLAQQQKLSDEVVKCTDPVTTEKIQAQQKMLESILEKVGEAAAVL